MTSNLQLNSDIRNDIGKGASRRLRRADKIPAVIYGADKEPKALTLNHNEVIKALENSESFSQILTINIAGKPEQVVLKDLQRHPFKPKILHMEFMRIKANEKITMLIPLHFVGEDLAPGVKQGGGKVYRIISEVEVRCLPADLPKHIEVDISKMELNSSLHLSDLILPKGIELPALAHGADRDQPIATLHIARMAEEHITPVTTVIEEVAVPEETEEKKEP